MIDVKVIKFPLQNFLFLNFFNDVKFRKKFNLIIKFILTQGRHENTLNYAVCISFY